MGGSDVVMAPQRCAWDPYAQEILNKWMGYTDRDGKKLTTKPHWAKQWVQYQVDGKLWVNKLKQDYEDEIIKFKRLLAAIGKEHGWTLGDLKERFSNDLFGSFYFDGVSDGEKPL
ncbi:hypothetical protein ACHAQH_007599 [Verticillium albo-atrum]